MSNKPTVLFVCIHNAGRSQMAAGYLTHLAGKTIDVLSAGSAPASSINPRVVEAMLEEGIDLANEIPKVLTVDSVQGVTWSSQWAVVTPVHFSLGSAILIGNWMIPLVRDLMLCGSFGMKSVVWSRGLLANFDRLLECRQLV